MTDSKEAPHSWVTGYAIILPRVWIYKTGTHVPQNSQIQEPGSSKNDGYGEMYGCGRGEALQCDQALPEHNPYSGKSRLTLFNGETVVQFMAGRYPVRCVDGRHLTLSCQALPATTELVIFCGPSYTRRLWLMVHRVARARAVGGILSW